MIRTTTEAARRIGTFSVVVGVVGALVAGAGIALQLPRLLAWNDPVSVDWDAAPDAVRVGDRWAGTGAARIPIPYGFEDQVLELTLVEAVGASDQALFSVLIDDTTRPEEWPSYLGYIDDMSTTLVPGYAGFDLLVEGEGDWTVELLPVDASRLIDVVDSATGDGDAVLVHRGGSTSGRLTVEGDGWVYATAYTPEGFEGLEDSDAFLSDPSSSAPRVSEFSFAGGAFVIIELVVIRDARWTLELDPPPATEPSGEPSAEPGAGPGPDADADIAPDGGPENGRPEGGEAP